MTSIPKCSLLVADDEPHILYTLKALLGHEFEVITAESGEAAKAVFAQRSVDMILSDQRMPGMSGVQLLEWVREHSSKTIRLLMTGFGELEDAVDAINRGNVYRYLFKPWRGDELLQTLRDASRTFRMERQNEELLQQSTPNEDRDNSSGKKTIPSSQSLGGDIQSQPPFLPQYSAKQQSVVTAQSAELEQLEEAVTIHVIKNSNMT